MTSSTAAAGSARIAPPQGWALRLVGGTTAGAMAMLVIGALVKPWVAGEHGQFHALFAVGFLVPAMALAVRYPAGGRASTPVILGFTILAFTQLVEGVGGFGYGPGNETRVNALAQVHDLGVAIAPLGLVAGAVGLTFGLAQRLRDRLGLWPALLAAAVLLGGLGVLIAKMIGL